MNALRVYHALPYPLKMAIASVRGHQLSTWRYGPETERLVEEALERDQWNPAQWRHWHNEQLGHLLHRAATRVPYYKALWDERRRRGDRASWEDLGNWPVLEKEPLRETPRAFIADGCDTTRMFHTHTSGTTGKPLSLWESREIVRNWYALCEARWRRWYGLSRYDRWAMVGGQLIASVRRRRPPFWVWNAAMNQLYASSYHLAPDLVPYYIDAFRKYRVAYVCGYSSSLYTLAQEILAQRLTAPPVRLVLTNAEPLYDFQRSAIQLAFGCPVRETYGMSEKAGAAAECENAHLHLWPDAGIFEVLNEDNTPARPGVTGDIVITGLVNYDMPLIRYRVRDRGSIAPVDERCGCGRGLPILRSVEGRIDDVVYTRDGRRVGRLDPVFKADLPVRDVQIVQESLDSIRILYVPAPGFDAVHARSIIERLQDRLGTIDVNLEPVAHIPAGPNGKFRAVISKVATEARAGSPVLYR